jgi:hypothetical protein
MKEEIKGIQIIGTQRSGSNLLRVMLEQSNEITALHPPHILQNFVPLLKQHPVSGKNEYRALVESVVDFIKCNPVPWDRITFDIDSLVSKAKSFSIFELFKLIYEEASRQRGTRYWCCKSMANFNYFNELECQNIRPKYIYLYRDGRDVALSFKKAVVGEKHIYHLAQQWRSDQLACLNLREQLGSDRFFAMRYEAFIADPEGSVKEVCRFLNVSFTNAMLDYHTSTESQLTASSGKMWLNLTQPVLKDNYGKFLKEFNETEIDIFELIAGDALVQLGYPLYSKGSRKELISPSTIERYHQENKLHKEEMQKANSVDFHTRNGQRFVIERMKSRFTSLNTIL